MKSLANSERCWSLERTAGNPLERRPGKPILYTVSGRTVLGDGPNSIELCPFRGETGERMMMAYLPETGLLYATDLFQGSRDGPPEYAWEVAEAVRRNHLHVTRLFAMHTDLTPWSRLLEILEKATKG